MVIDSHTHLLENNNYVDKINLKTQIVIGNSFNNNLDYIKGWKKRYGGRYKKVTTFSIDKKGNIYQHYDESHHSKIMGKESLDKNIITITAR